MEKRRLADGFEVSALGLGCMGMSEFYGPCNDATSLEVLHKAADLGVDFFDTADMYGPYHNEALLGRFLKTTAHPVKIATKFGIVREPGAYARTLEMSPDYIRQSCEASLSRLGVERIDLYYVHRVNPEQDIEAAMGALSQLVDEGKIDRVGLCEVRADTLRRAHCVHPVTAVQTEYSLWSRGVEAEILPACRELGVGFVPYAPLGRGFLTGRFENRDAFGTDDFRPALPRFQNAAMQENMRIVEVLREIAQQKGCTPGQLALAWLLAQGPDIVPIPGTKQIGYLTENVAAADITLSAQDLAAIGASVDALQVSGARYTDEGMKGVNA
ncbi:aldo/keto reductase [Rhodobacteraceae bacterium]|nr:aldo/keto reductase [Paracoccaceae bacterium]